MNSAEQETFKKALGEGKTLFIVYREKPEYKGEIPKEYLSETITTTEDFEVLL